MAFGTGHHPTTRMCLEILEETVRPGVDVLDLGCGSGILAIAAAKLGARSVRGLEIDAVAAAVAESNVRQNDVAASVSIAHGTLPHPDVHRRGFDVALANISAKVVVELAEELAAALRPRGTLVVSGVLLENESRVSGRLSEVGFVPTGRRVDGDWVTTVVLAP
jgi:ribosomal protein L11 methyltransferase